MKIIISLLAITIISMTFVVANTEEICRQAEVKVYSSIQPVSQTFNLDIKKIKGISFKVDENEFKANALIPIEQVGFVLEKTPASKVLDAIQHKYLRNEPESVWLPYAFTGDWSRNGFVISNQMKRTATSKTETPLVSFEFVNDIDLDNVTNADMDKFLNSLRFNSEKRKTIKTIVKNKVMNTQNAYIEADKSLKSMQTKNQNAQNQITELKAKLQIVITEINTLTQTETTLRKEESVKSAALTTVDDQINDLIGKLAVLNKQLKNEELSLNQTKPTDITSLQYTLKSSLLNVQFPPKSPERFLEEYSIASGQKFQYVQENYNNCVQKENLLQQCMMATFKSSQIKKKLRRSFF